MLWSKQSLSSHVLCTPVTQNHPKPWKPCPATPQRLTRRRSTATRNTLISTANMEASGAEKARKALRFWLTGKTLKKTSQGKFSVVLQSYTVCAPWFPHRTAHVQGFRLVWIEHRLDFTPSFFWCLHSTEYSQAFSFPRILLLCSGPFRKIFQRKRFSSLTALKDSITGSRSIQRTSGFLTAQVLHRVA